VPAPTATPTPRPAPTPEPPGPWQGEYFDNYQLTGASAVTRQDAAIDFNWGRDAPAPEVSADNFSVRWAGTFPFEAGRYRFTTLTDDGVRLYVDDQRLISAWYPMRGTRNGYITLSAGDHDVRVEYFERRQAARAHVTWERVGAAPSTATPAPDERGASGPWQASYYDNHELDGEPVLTRQDEVLDFNWGWESPADDVPVDGFSAVWQREVELDGGRYTFSTTSDDGVRLYVDGELVIDSWRPMRGYRSATLSLGEGKHTVRLAYFERSGIALVRLNWRKR
jgi:hypothetical protein